MANGGTYQQQATLSIVCYALMVKFLFAPLIDAYYIKYLGKNKTYVVSLGIICGVLVLIFAPRADEAVEEKRILLLAGFWLFVNLLANFQQVAFESWSLTLVKKEDMGYITGMLVTGFATGMSVSLNAFVCLNSTSWLNRYIYRIDSEKDPKGLG